jgi:hypothetical protein
MNLEENQTMEDLMRRTLLLAAESSAEILDMLSRIVDNAEYEDDVVKLDPKLMDEARNFLHEFKFGPVDSDTLH